MRTLTVMKKTVADFSTPRAVALYLVPFVLVATLVSLGIAETMPDNIARLPLHHQERELVSAYVLLSYVWAAGIPVMVLGAVLSANSLAKESERGSLRILLSKPVRRWEVFFGTFGAVFLFSFLVAVAGLLLASLLVFWLSGASATALDGGVVSLVPGNLAFAVILTFVVAALGTSIAVFTGSRLQTALAVLLVPALFLAFLFVRPMTGDLYEDYFLYLPDVNYHLGNIFVFVHQSAGSEFTPITQTTLGQTTGVFDVTSARIDPIFGGMPTSLPLSGYVPPVVSLVLVLLVPTVLLVLALRRFQQMDIT